MRIASSLSPIFAATAVLVLVAQPSRAQCPVGGGGGYGDGQCSQVGTDCDGVWTPTPPVCPGGNDIQCCLSVHCYADRNDLGSKAVCADQTQCTDPNKMDGTIQYYNADGSATCPQFPNNVGCCYGW